MSLNNYVGNYDANDIKVLEGLEAVRKRPGMYIGSTGPDGLHHLVYEIVDNAIDEALCGYCHTIEVILNYDGSVTVTDDGRGIPVDKHESGNVSALEIVFTKLHAGGKFGDGAYKVSGGLHGVGASVVNALSEFLEVRVFKNGSIYFAKFKRGAVCEELKVIGTTNKSGTEITFKPDLQIFESIIFNYDILLRRLREEAFLNPGISITLIDKREETEGELSLEDCYEENNPLEPLNGLENTKKERKIKLKYDGGIREFVAYLDRNKTPLHPISYLSRTESDCEVEIALCYNDGFAEKIMSFANNVHTVGGGTHESAFKFSLTKIINEYARKYQFLKENDKDFQGEDTREGLTSVISVKVVEAQFEGQTKTKLGNTGLRPIVDDMFKNQFMAFLEENPNIAKIVMEKVKNSFNAREASRKARELARKKTSVESLALPSKLADCSERDKTQIEIYIVEGDSAGGSAKQGRDRRYQAILPLWGKMLNVEKSRVDKVYNSEKFHALIAALGVGLGKDFDMEKLRYGKIIIMADADVDGSHIRTLLLTFFFRFMTPLVENGCIYIAQPPLYKISKNRTTKYAFNDNEMHEILKEMPSAAIQRYKGLGEMNPEQLWETTMDPKTRTMIKVTLKDAEEASEVFSLLMGDKVEPRRKFIEIYAKTAQNIDI